MSINPIKKIVNKCAFRPHCLILISYLKNALRGGLKLFVLGRLLSNFITLTISSLLYRFIFEAEVSDQFISYTGSDDYVGFVFVGLIFFSFSHALITSVGRYFVDEKREGTIATRELTLIGRFTNIFLILLAQVIVLILESVLLIILARVFLDISFHLSIAFVISLFILIVIMYFISVLVSFFMIVFNDTFIIQNTVMTIIYISSGVLFPINLLPNHISKICSVLPTTWALETMRVAFIRNSISFVHYSVLFYLFIGILVLCYFVIYFNYKKILIKTSFI